MQAQTSVVVMISNPVDGVCLMNGSSIKNDSMVVGPGG